MSILGTIPMFNSINPFPEVMGRSGGVVVNNTDFSLPLPAGIAIGDLIVIGVSTHAVNARTFSGPPSGYTPLYNQAGAGNHRFLAAFYRQATLSDVGASSVSMSASAGCNWAGTSYRIFKASRIDAAAVSSSVDPPSHTTGYGVNGKLWISFLHTVGSTSRTAPSGMGNQQSQQQATNVAVNSADLILDAASYDPAS
ncbi:MAG: hypothetical protein E6Q97_32370, partial [Desulfurellales bacterium]